MKKEKIEDFFEDRRSTIFLGAAGLAYFVYHFTAAKTAFRLAPPMKPTGYAVLFVFVSLAQSIVWRYLKRADEKTKWARFPLSLFYFLCEFGLIAFSLSLAFWPIFLMFRSKLI